MPRPRRAGAWRPRRRAARELGRHQLDLALEERAADLRLLRGRRAVSGRTPVDDVGDVHVRLAQPDGREHLVEQLAGAADERLALQVLVAAGRLADQHEAGLGCAAVEAQVLGRGLEAQPSKWRAWLPASSSVAAWRAALRAAMTAASGGRGRELPRCHRGGPDADGSRAAAARAAAGARGSRRRLASVRAGGGRGSSGLARHRPWPTSRWPPRRPPRRRPSRGTNRAGPPARLLWSRRACGAI